MTTDIELAELRYSGKPAAFLRGFRAVYLGVVMNCIILGWVNLAMVKILMLVLGLSKDQALWLVIGIIALTSFISTLSGLWGVLVTDLFQFAIKMTMVIVLGVAAVRAVGGIDAMKAKLGGEAARSSASCPISIPSGCPPSPSSSTSPSTGGPPGIRAPNPAAAATSRSACSARRTSATPCSPRSGSTSRTTRCAPGRGLSSAWRR